MSLYKIVSLILVVVPFAISYPGKGRLEGTTRIVNGRRALKNEIPYIVAVGWAFNFKNPIYGYSKKCGGAIFSTKFIITAAHCFRPDQYPEEYAVMAGGLNAEECFIPGNKCGVQVIRLKHFINHPGWNSSVDAEGHFANDISILELEQPLELNDGVQPIPIPPAGTVASGKARVSGWGDTKKRLAYSEDFDKPNRSHVLLTAEVDIIPREQCDRMFAEAKVVDVVWWSFKTNYHPKQSVAPHDDTLLCAGDLEGGRDICTGDSGGPLECSRKKADGKMEKYLCGVVSSGVGCGLPLPSAYTEVARYHDWILQHTKEK